MLRQVLCVLGVSSLLIAAPLSVACAADMPLKAPAYAPPPAPVPSWTGCYIDAGAGYALWNQDHYFEVGPPVGAFTPLTVTQTNGGRGWLGRFGGGCDYQTPLFNGRLLIGAFADYDAKNVVGSWSEAAGFAGTENESASWAAGGRIGFLLTPGTLTYADGGWTQARFDSFGLVSGLGGVALPFNMVAQTYNGWFLGSGAETQISGWFPGLPSGLFLRTEYRYSSFGARDVPIIITPTGALTGVYEHNTIYEQSITTSLVWKFNWLGR
jgi:outer membrane immunogenic protein